MVEDDLSDAAKEGCELLKTLALDTLNRATDLASRLSTNSRRSRSGNGLERLLDPPKVQAYRYLKQLEEGPAVCPEHIDGGLLTVIVHRGPCGLQIYDQLSGEWVDERVADTEAVVHAAVDDEPIPLFATVLVGHTLEVASGGTYRAALHRVISHTEFDRLSVVLKLHLKDEVRLPGAETTAGDLLAKFKRDRPTVNPLPADGRVSAVGPVSFDKRRVDEEACPMHVCVFMQEYPMEFPDEQDRPFPRLTEPTILPLCGPLRHSMEYPVLCNPFYTLWVLKEWSRDADVELNEDVRRRIMQLGTWVPTTAADVIRAITTHVQAASGPNERPVTEGNVRLHLDPSNLIGINSKNVNKPLPELIPRGTTYPLKWSVVNGLSFLSSPYHLD